jgi:hypothetical protein
MNYMGKLLTLMANTFHVGVQAVVQRLRLQRVSVMLLRATMSEVQFVGRRIAMG